MQQRCYAETAVAKELDWDALEDTLGTDEARREVATLRSTYMDVERRFKEMSKVSAVPALCRLSAGVRCHTCVCLQLSRWQRGWQGCQSTAGSVKKAHPWSTSTGRCRCALRTSCAAFTAAAAAALVLLEAPEPSAAWQAGVLILRMQVFACTA